jgi:hypothetical protein
LQVFGGFLLLAALFVPCPAGAQRPGETKIPKIGKIMGGPDRQAFTGKVQSVDKKLKLLNMIPEEGQGSEIFPVKKNVEIRNVHGERISLGALKPGTDVVVYYELKGTERSVKQIIELSPGATKAEKKPSKPS